MNASATTVTPDRFFSSEELVDLAKTTADKALDALLSGDTKTAREICYNADRNEHAPIRSAYTLWTGQTLTYFYGRLGIGAVRDLLHFCTLPWLQPFAEQFRIGVTREAVSNVARFLRHEATERPVIIEDDRSITFALKGLGHRRLMAEGAYDAGSAAPLTFVAQPDVLTGGEPNTPIYRTTSFATESLLIEILGYPAFVLDYGSDEIDRITIFKDPATMPDRYFDRVGATKDEIKMAAACGLAGGRLFSDAELEEMSSTKFELAVKAIDAGDLSRAEGLCRQAQFDWYPGHHLFRDWLASQLSWIETNYPSMMEDYVTVCYERGMVDPMLEALMLMDPADVTRAFAHIFRQHAKSFHIEEDENTVVFVAHPCGSGGRLIAEEVYDRRPGFTKIKKASPLTFGLSDFPAYCVHCPITNRKLFNRGDSMYEVVEPGIKDGKLTGHCKLHMFKSKEAVPPELYDMVGLKKNID